MPDDLPSEDEQSDYDDRLDPALDELERQEKERPTKEDVARIDRRSRMRTNIAVSVSIVIAAIGLILSTKNSGDISDAKAQAAINDVGISALKEANERLAAQGLPQIPVPQPGQPIDPNAIAIAAAGIVRADIRNDPNFRGPSGASGAPGSAITGPSGAPCLPSNPDCRGPSGESGAPGVSGASGAPGSPCDPATLPACVGPSGASGAPGQPGQGFDPNNPPHFEGTPDSCELVLSYINPVRQDRFPMNGVLCTPPAPPVTTTTTTTLELPPPILGG